MAALLVTWMTVQQQAARSEVSRAGACFAGACLAGQQQTERVVPSSVQRYHDAVAIYGTRTSASRIRTTRRTCDDYTRLAGGEQGAVVVVRSGMALVIRTFARRDEDAVVALWRAAGLTRPWNDPHADIARKLAVQPELFLVGELGGEIVASAMAGYDGHRGSLYYLAVSPGHQRRGHAGALMAEVERRLEAIGCPKLNLMVRRDNTEVLGFYHQLGYDEQSVVVLGKRLIADEPQP